MELCDPRLLCAPCWHSIGQGISSPGLTDLPANFLSASPSLKARILLCIGFAPLQLPELAEFEVGLANLFVQHTSASLTINENASPGAQRGRGQRLGAGADGWPGWRGGWLRTRGMWPTVHWGGSIQGRSPGSPTLHLPALPPFTHQAPCRINRPRCHLCPHPATRTGAAVPGKQAPSSCPAPRLPALPPFTLGSLAYLAPLAPISLQTCCLLDLARKSYHPLRSAWPASSHPLPQPPPPVACRRAAGPCRQPGQAGARGQRAAVPPR